MAILSDTDLYRNLVEAAKVADDYTARHEGLPDKQGRMRKKVSMKDDPAAAAAALSLIGGGKLKGV